MFDRVMNTPLDDTSRLGNRANVCYCFEIEAKLKQFRTLFWRHSLTTILDTKLRRFRGGFFKSEVLEVFTRAFLLKIIIRT